MSSLLRTYVIPIMSCQDKVLEECRDQVGLLEEISLQQQNLLDVCEESERGHYVAWRLYGEVA